MGCGGSKAEIPQCTTLGPTTTPTQSSFGGTANSVTQQEQITAPKVAGPAGYGALPTKTVELPPWMRGGAQSGAGAVPAPNGSMANAEVAVAINLSSSATAKVAIETGTDALIGTSSEAYALAERALNRAIDLIFDEKQAQQKPVVPLVSMPQPGQQDGNWLQQISHRAQQAAQQIFGGQQQQPQQPPWAQQQNAS